MKGGYHLERQNWHEWARGCRWGKRVSDIRKPEGKMTGHLHHFVYFSFTSRGGNIYNEYINGVLNVHEASWEFHDASSCSSTSMWPRWCLSPSLRRDINALWACGCTGLPGETDLPCSAMQIPWKSISASFTLFLTHCWPPHIIITDPDLVGCKLGLPSLPARLTPHSVLVPGNPVLLKGRTPNSPPPWPRGCFWSPACFERS